MIKTPLKIYENGEANSYAILDNDGKWLLSFLHNGEALIEQQRETIQTIVNAINSHSPIKR